MLDRPQAGDYADYAQSYIDCVPEGDVLQMMDTEHAATQTFLANLPSEKEDYRYAEGKWSIKEILQHLIDTERVMAYRALRIARGEDVETSQLAGFDQDLYVINARASERSMADLLAEFQALRSSSSYMFRSFVAECFTLAGYANNYRVTVLALAYVIVGHELHHLKIIKERYL